MTAQEKDLHKKNTVKAEGQLATDHFVMLHEKPDAALRVLFIGNSITFHEFKAEIGWERNWGMAASSPEKDYVHQTVAALEERFGPISYGIAQVSYWECHFDQGSEILDAYYTRAAEFGADIVIVRIGENIFPKMHEENSCIPYYEDMIRFFAGKARQVIVTNNFWPREDLDGPFEDVAKRNGYTFCCLNDLAADKATMALGEFEHEGICLHPSDYGMAKIAERIVEQVKG
ncbi:MAG: SGNH/GDSL hydrolase family protein [Clostridia bacterium]|nr:SGNH/GDSL hydrolase family protein [Clostridia bacterium]